VSIGRTFPGAAASALLSGLPGYYNFTAQNLANWRTARNAGLADVIFLGDSKTAGYAVNYTNKRATSPADVIATNLGWNRDTLFGNNNVGLNGFTVAQYDPRCAIVGTVVVTNNSGYNGSALNFTSGSGINFTAGAAFDTIEVFVGTTPGGGNLTVAVNGGSVLQTISCNAANGVARAVVSTGSLVAAGGVLNIRSSSGTAYLFGFRLTNSAAPKITIVNAGAAGYTAALHNANNSFSCDAVCPVLRTNLTLLELGTNEYNGGTSRAVFRDGLSNVVAKAQQKNSVDNTRGSIILAVPTHIQSENTTTYGNIEAAIFDVAGTSIPVIHFGELFGSWTTANANGFMSDGFHESVAGYAQKATYIQTALLA
jgi:hypothetical protein